MPLSFATSKGFFLSTLRWPTSAPCSMSTWTKNAWPSTAATKRGDSPLTLALLMSAFASSSFSTTALWPFRTAKKSGLAPLSRPSIGPRLTSAPWYVKNEEINRGM